MRNRDGESDVSRLSERRRETRYTLILRVGVLEQYGKSSLCLVKNISSAGLQLKCYARPIVEGHATIRVADEASIRGRIVWLDGDIAGMSFDDELDDASLLRVQQKLRPTRRRTMPRISVEATAVLRTGGRIAHAIVRDISSMGARIRTSSPLVKGARAIIALHDLPALDAYVRWITGDEAGLVFETPVPMQVIAHWIESRFRLAS
jgi:hypothetical protein